MIYHCPICDKVIPSATTMEDGRKRMNAPYFPFCSERCRLIDLGAWLDERYRVAAESDSEDEEGAVPDNDGRDAQAS